MRKKSIVVADSVRTVHLLLLFALSCSIISCARAKADPEAPKWPVNETLVLSKQVTIKTIQVNKAAPPKGAVEEAANWLKQYVAGEVVVTPPKIVHLDPGKNNSLLLQHVDSMMRNEPAGPSTIRIYFIPMHLPDRSGDCTGPSEGNNGYVIRLYGLSNKGRWITLGGILLPRKMQYRQGLRHELAHALGVPYGYFHLDESYRGGHCSNPDCLLYTHLDAQMIAAAVRRLGVPVELCNDCRTEILDPLKKVGRATFDPDRPFNWMESREKRLNGLVRLNPEAAGACAERAAFYSRIGRDEKAIADYTKAIELLSLQNKTEGPGISRDDLYCMRSSVWLRRKEYGKAVNGLTEALSKPGDHATPGVLLAWILATCPDPAFRDGQRALELAKGAQQQKDQHRRVIALAVLAAAHAEQGDFRSAIAVQIKACAWAEPGAQMDEYRIRLELYRSGKAYRMVENIM